MPSGRCRIGGGMQLLLACTPPSQAQTCSPYAAVLPFANAAVPSGSAVAGLPAGAALQPAGCGPILGLVRWLPGVAAPACSPALQLPLPCSTGLALLLGCGPVCRRFTLSIQRSRAGRTGWAATTRGMCWMLLIRAFNSRIALCFLAGRTGWAVTTRGMCWTLLSGLPPA